MESGITIAEIDKLLEDEDLDPALRKVLLAKKEILLNDKDIEK